MHDNRHSDWTGALENHSPGDHRFGDLKFTITNGTVTGEARVINGITVSMTLPSDATFSVGTGTVTETITRGSTTRALTYAVDGTDSSLYHLTQDATTFDTTAANSPSYTFTVSNGAVTALSEFLGSSSNAHTVDVTKLPATSFAVAGNTVTETTVHGNVLETLQFTSTDGSTYKLASDTQITTPLGTAGTALDVEPHDRMSFTFSGNTVTAAQFSKADGSTEAVASNASTTVTYAQPVAGYVVETITHGSHTAYEVFHDGNGDGIYTEVAHGSGTTVDIVGLQAQITTAMNTLL